MIFPGYAKSALIFIFNRISSQNGTCLTSSQSIHQSCRIFFSKVRKGSQRRIQGWADQVSSPPQIFRFTASLLWNSLFSPTLILSSSRCTLFNSFLYSFSYCIFVYYSSPFYLYLYFYFNYRSSICVHIFVNMQLYFLCPFQIKILYFLFLRLHKITLIFIQ